mgnify:CR=1 FL=1
MKKPNQSKSWFTLIKKSEGETRMEKRFDVIAMGELLIDFTMNGQSEQEITCSKPARAERV